MTKGRVMVRGEMEMTSGSICDEEMYDIDVDLLS